MKKIIRISQKNLGELLNREIKKYESQNQNNDINTIKEDSIETTHNIQLNDSEVALLLDILKNIHPDDDSEKQLITNIVSNLTNPSI